MKLISIFLLSAILFSTNALAENKKIIISIKDMSCSLCVISINQALRTTSGVIKAKASLKLHQAEVIVPDNFAIEKLLVAISNTGYTGEVKNVIFLQDESSSQR